MEPHRRLVNKAHHDPGTCAERAPHGSPSTQAEARPDSFRLRLAVWRDAWRRFCHAHHLEPSMSRHGNCWDNAVAESFFSSLKKERMKKRIDKTREMATAEIDE
jgi:transposase InsO family protein